MYTQEQKNIMDVPCWNAEKKLGGRFGSFMASVSKITITSGAYNRGDETAELLRPLADRI